MNRSISNMNFFITLFVYPYATTTALQTIAL